MQMIPEIILPCLHPINADTVTHVKNSSDCWSSELLVPSGRIRWIHVPDVDN
jgi:hypothetical protein